MPPDTNHLITDMRRDKLIINDSTFARKKKNFSSSSFVPSYCTKKKQFSGLSLVGPNANYVH